MLKKGRNKSMIHKKSFVVPLFSNAKKREKESNKFSCEIKVFPLLSITIHDFGFIFDISSLIQLLYKKNKKRSLQCHAIA